MRVGKILVKSFREITVILIWSYLITKLFVFDVDIGIVKLLAPNYSWLLDYKFFFFLALLALFLLTWKKTLLHFFLFAAFYPFILIWRIIQLIIKRKSWVLGIALLNITATFIQSFRYYIITATLLSISILVLLLAANKFVLGIFIILLLSALLYAYFRRIKIALKPSTLFQEFNKALSKPRETSLASLSLEESIKNLPYDRLNPEQLQKWKSCLQSAVIMNRFCLVGATKLRDYQRSNLNVLMNVFTLLTLMLLTITVFAALNFGLYKIEPANYNVTSNPSQFEFFYYSFNNLVHSSVIDIQPVSTLAKVVSMGEFLLAIILLLVMASQFLPMQSERHTAELNTMIEGLEKEGEFLETFITQEFRVPNLRTAIEVLDKLKAESIDFIYRLTKIISP